MTPGISTSATSSPEGSQEDPSARFLQIAFLGEDEGSFAGNQNPEARRLDLHTKVLTL
jgi:hypothetical protein